MPNPTRRPRRELLSRMPNELKNQITSYLGLRDLSRLARTCRLWHELGIALLYTRDARDENSSAIRWAALKSASKATNLDVNQTVIRRSVEHGGDVNAFHKHHGWRGTALHFAAARGRQTLVKDLLGWGADARAVSSGLDLYASLGIVSLDARKDYDFPYLNRDLRESLTRTEWLPLLIPFVRRQYAIVKLLFAAGAPAQVAVSRADWEAAPHTGVITVYHLFTGITDDEFHQAADLNHRIFHDSRADLNATLPKGEGYSALHLVVEASNTFMMDKLLEAGAHVDVATDLGRTPLISAVKLCGDAESLGQLKFLMEAIKSLIRHGADVNHHSHAVVDETPLICAVLAETRDCKTGPRHMRAIMEILIDKGARVNQMSSGRTAVHHLCARILYNGGVDQPLLDHLQYLLQSGGDINLPMLHSQKTVLREFLARNKLVTPALLRHMLRLGASIQPYEADDVLKFWIQSPRLRSVTTGYNALQHKQHFTKAAIDDAYGHVFLTEDRDLFFRLQEAGLRPRNASELTCMAVKTHNHKLFPQVEYLKFDANWRDEAGLSYLHMLVVKLATTKYREKQAVEDAMFLIERGTSVLLKDQEGMTALQQLRRKLEGRFSDLRLVLLEAKDKERGEL